MRKLIITAIVALSAAGSILATAAVPVSASAASASTAPAVSQVFYHG